MFEKFLFKTNEYTIIGFFFVKEGPNFKFVSGLKKRTRYQRSKIVRFFFFFIIKLQ